MEFGEGCGMEPTTTGERLEVRYELSETDAVYCYWQGVLGHGRTRVARLLLFVGVTAFFGFLGGPAVGAGLGAGLLFLVLVLVPWLIRRQARGNPAFRGPHTTWISPEALGGTTESLGTTEVLWQNVREIRSTPSHVLLCWRTGAMTIIPRSAFASAGEAEEFMRRADAWREAAVTASG